MNYKHKEAFCHMQYFGKQGNKTVSVSIWNSTDGVTPIVTQIRELGIELQHVNWNQDRFDPNYKPKKGDLIWIPHNSETALKLANESFNRYVGEYEEFIKLTKQERVQRFGYDPVEILQNYIDSKDDFLVKSVESILREHGEPQPHLVLVEEDWK